MLHKYKNDRPAWWLLDAIVMVTIGLLYAQRMHAVVMFAITLLGHGLIWLWLWTNRVALERWDRERHADPGDAQHWQAQEERPAPKRDVDRDRSLTPVQAHFRQVMLAKQPRNGRSASEKKRAT